MKTLKSPYLSWDKLPSARCPLSFSNQNPQSSICCFLFSLLLVGCTDWREPPSTQLGLVGEPGATRNAIRKIQHSFLTHFKTPRHHGNNGQIMNTHIHLRIFLIYHVFLEQQKSREMTASIFHINTSCSSRTQRTYFSSQ